LRGLPVGSSIAVETVGNWYWIVDEMQQAGHQPRLAHARKAKLMMGQLDKTDKLDARGLATLLRNGTLPEVWIPSRETRDQRELLRLRMTLCASQPIKCLMLQHLPWFLPIVGYGTHQSVLQRFHPIKLDVAVPSPRPFCEIGLLAFHIQ
jgi:hypothetical protein